MPSASLSIPPSAIAQVHDVLPISLDINLGGEMVYPVADELRARGIPFIFATGYEAWSIPRAYADVPRAEKPVELTQATTRLIK